MKESLFESTMRRTKEIIQKWKYPKCCRKIGNQPSTITRWFAEEGRAPSLMHSQNFEFFSVEIVFPGEIKKR